jgi:hypothetical protein
MTYLANFSTSMSSMMILNATTQAVTDGLFESVLTPQQSLSNENFVFSSGASMILPVLACRSDGDIQVPICSMLVADATSQDSRIASQVASSTNINQRSYVPNNVFFVSSKGISLTNTIWDSGDQVLNSGFCMLIMPIKG